MGYPNRMQTAIIPRISVIVPMHRCESYVDRLMDMLLHQTFPDFELICVVDGSPDNTLERANARAKADSRIVVISQECKGAGAARNTGLLHARGEYLMFLDADDLYNPNYFERMVEVADKHHADIVICRYCEKNNRTGEELHGRGFDIARVKTEVPIDPARMASPFTTVEPVPHNKIWRHDFVRRTRLQFSTTMGANDLFFARASFVCATRVVFIADELYTWRVFHNAASISSNRHLVADNFINASRQLHGWLKERGIFAKWEEDFCTQWRWSFHYAAQFGESTIFQERCAKALGEDEPWAAMDGRRLCRHAGLYTALATWRIRSLKRQTGRRTRGDESALYWKIAQAESQVANIDAVRKLLNERYGKQVPTRDSLAEAIWWKVRERGGRSALRTLYIKLRGR